MLKDTDMIDNVEVTDIAQQCVLLKKKEDEVAELEEKLKAKKEEAMILVLELYLNFYKNRDYKKLN